MKLKQTLFFILFKKRKKRHSSKGNRAPTKLTLSRIKPTFFNDRNSHQTQIPPPVWLPLNKYDPQRLVFKAKDLLQPKTKRTISITFSSQPGIKRSDIGRGHMRTVPIASLFSFTGLNDVFGNTQFEAAKAKP